MRFSRTMAKIILRRYRVNRTAEKTKTETTPCSQPRPREHGERFTGRCTLLDFAAAADRSVAPPKVVVGRGPRVGFGVGGDCLADRDFADAGLW